MAHLSLDWLQLVALLGAAQGVFLAGVLVARRKNRTANRLLAAAMLAFSVHLASVVYFGAGLVPEFPHFFGVAYPLPLLYGPLIWLYAVTAADRKRGLHARDALHLVPFAAVVIFGLPIYLLDGAGKVALYHRLVAGDQPLLLAIADPLKLVSGVAYAIATVVFLRRHQERVKDSYSTVERVGLRWLLTLGMATAAIWGLAVVFQLLESIGIARIGRGDDVVSLAMAVLVYGIGYMGLRQPEVFRYETSEYPVAVRAPMLPAATASPVVLSSVAPSPVALSPVALSPVAPTPAAPASNASEVEAEPSPRYERSGLTERQALRLRDALLSLMEGERPWRDSELTLADLAERLKTTPHKLSEVLNA